ncbi:hypothetical protein [Halobellus sp. EA9]|uniref:hypothetical protein n=1 Tax=Halobellus sp. EA9 TaxID=3421647 RepID=UPI003EB7C8B9
MTPGKPLAVAVVLVAFALLAVPSGGFGVIDEVRDARVGVAAPDRAVVSIEPAAEVPVRCSAPLVTVRNNGAQSATVTVRLTESGGGSLLAPNGADRGTEYVFDLDSGDSRTVSVVGVRSGADAVDVTVTAELDGGLVVTASERVPTYVDESGGDGDGDDGDDDDDDDDDDYDDNDDGDDHDDNDDDDGAC